MFEFINWIKLIPCYTRFWQYDLSSGSLLENSCRRPTTCLADLAQPEKTRVKQPGRRKSNGPQDAKIQHSSARASASKNPSSSTPGKKQTPSGVLAALPPNWAQAGTSHCRAIPVLWQRMSRPFILLTSSDVCCSNSICCAEMETLLFNYC